MIYVIERTEYLELLKRFKDKDLINKTREMLLAQLYRGRGR